jgi:hypothetical protein
MKCLLVVREEILEDVVVAIAPGVPVVIDIRHPDVQKLVDGSILGTVKADDGQS